MVVRSVIDEVDMSLGQLKVKMPEGAKLLFEILAAPDEGAVEFEYCFVLVRPVSNGILYKVERELVLSALLVEKNPQMRAQKVCEWLSDDGSMPQQSRFLLFVRRKDGAFIPYRVPSDYLCYGEVSFLEVCPRVA